MRGGYTPAHLAADAGQCDTLAALAEAGAPLEARSTKGWTPLALATIKVPQGLTLGRENVKCLDRLRYFVPWKPLT